MYIRITAAEIQSSEKTGRELLEYARALGAKIPQITEESDLPKLVAEYNGAPSRALKMSLTLAGDLELEISSEFLEQTDQLVAKTYKPFMALAAAALPLILIFKTNLSSLKNSWAEFAETWRAK